MDLPVELVGLLKHAGINGNNLTWDLQVNSSAISVKLMWIKAEKPVEKKQDKLPARPRKRNTSLLPPGKEILNASTSGRRKGTYRW
jgi:hypothetical protein